MLTAGYDHSFDLGDAGTLTAGISSRYKSAFFANFFNFNDSRQKGFTQTDLTLGWSPASELFNVLLFARNLENTRPLSYGGYTAAGPDDVFNWQFGTPRTYGIRVAFDY